MDQAGQAGLHPVENPRVPLRIAVLVAAILLTTTAVAEPDALQKFHRWLWPNAPRTEPVVVEPLPPISPYHPIPDIAPAPTSEVPVALPKPRPKVVERQPRRRPFDLKPVEGITCAQARQGVGMPCFLIRSNAWQYEQLSPAQKRQADSCLTEAERAAIRVCFR